MRINLTLILFLLLIGCTKEKDLVLPGTYPLIITREYSELDDNGVTLRAQLKRFEGGNVSSYGFKWSTGNLEYEQIIKAPPTEHIELRVDSDIIPDAQYEYQAFAEGNGQRYYGEKLTFTGMGGMPPQILGLDKKSGEPGSILRLLVRYVSRIDSRVSVRVNGKTVPIIARTAETIDIQIPYDLNAGYIEIQLFSGSAVSGVNQEFYVIGPAITSISSTEVFTGDVLVIHGEYFPENADGLRVYVGSHQATIISNSFTEIRIVVPIFTTGLASVRINSSGMEARYDGQLMVKKPWKEVYSGAGGYAYAIFEYNGEIYTPRNWEITKYDPSTGVKTSFMQYTTKEMAGATFVSYQDKVYRLGGSTNFYSNNDYAVIDMVNKTYTHIADMPFTLTNVVTFTIDKYAYFLTNAAEVWRMDMESGVFTQMADGPDDLKNHAFTYKKSGTQYVATTIAIHIYHPATDSWEEVHFDGDTKDLPDFYLETGFYYNNKLYMLHRDGVVYEYYPDYKFWEMSSWIPINPYDNYLIYEHNGKIRMYTYEHKDYEYQR